MVTAANALEDRDGMIEKNLEIHAKKTLFIDTPN